MGLHLTGSSVTQLNNAIVTAIAAQTVFTVVDYAGNVSAPRPDAQFVSWRGFPAQPTNMLDSDEWLDDTPETYPVQTVTYAGDATVARPTGATVVIWNNFPTQPTNMADGDLWIDPATEGQVRSSASAPTSGDGNDGDFWIKTGSSPVLYGPKAAGAWPTGVSLVGPTGPAGPSTTGIPTGGSLRQVLRKASSTDYDVTWGNAYVPSFVAIASGSYVFAYGGLTVTSVAMTDGQLRLVPFYLAQSLSIARAGTEIVSAGSTGSVFRMAIYDDAGGYPGVPLLDETLDSTSTGVKEVTLGSTLVLPPGWYWAGGVGQGAPTTVPNVRCSSGQTAPLGFLFVSGTTIPGSSFAIGAYQKTSVSGALPTFGVPTSSTTSSAPRLFFKVA